MRIIAQTRAAEPQLDPDLVWNGETGDMAISAATDTDNPSGLASGNALRTAVIVALLTDRRAETSELRDGDINRGWPGDGFDLDDGETPLGSKLWLLRRSALTASVARRAEDYAMEALQPLIDQGAFVRFDVEATISAEGNRLDLAVAGYGRDGARRFHERFGIHWEKIA